MTIQYCENIFKDFIIAVLENKRKFEIFNPTKLKLNKNCCCNNKLSETFNPLDKVMIMQCNSHIFQSFFFGRLGSINKPSPSPYHHFFYEFVYS